jgi:hypothetical protein
MNAWQELVRQALIGNISSKKISPLLLEQFQQYGLNLSPNQAPETILLKAAAIQNKLYSVAQIPLSVPSEAGQIAPEESLDYCHNQRRHQLQYILKHRYDEMLIELLDLLKDHCQIVAPDLLPELLNYGVKRPLTQELIIACIGNRGHWLAQFSETWSYAQTTEKADDVFFYGNYEERSNFLRKVRLHEPTRALELLEQVWDSEGFNTKASFLKVLQHNLSSSDEAFLNTALEDNRQEVRSQAAILLALIPTSQLVQRMQTLISQLVIYDPKKNEINVELPATCTAKMKIDGIAPRQTFIKDHGPKANQLAQIIAKIPPEWWEKTFSKTPQELFVLATKTEWKNVFVWAWAMAAKNFQSEDWIVACHRFYLDTFFKHNWSNFSIDFLYQDLPNDLFNTLAGEYLKTDNRPTLSDDHPIVSFLLAEGQSWNETITKKIIQRIKNTIEQDTYVFHWSIKAVIKRASFSIPPQLYEVVKEGWPTQSHGWHSWQKEVDSMLSILKVRQEILTLEDDLI